MDDDGAAATLFERFSPAGASREDVDSALRDANAPGYVSKVMTYGDQLEKLALRDVSDNQCPDRPDASKS